jgi:hypothetical protein
VKTKFSKSFATWFFPVGEDIRRIVVDWVTYLRHEKLWGLDDPLFRQRRSWLGTVGISRHRPRPQALEQRRSHPGYFQGCNHADRNWGETILGTKEKITQPKLVRERWDSESNDNDTNDSPRLSRTAIEGHRIVSAPLGIKRWEPAPEISQPGWLRSRFMGKAWPRAGRSACGREKCEVCGRLDRARLSQQSDEDGRLVCSSMTT